MSKVSLREYIRDINSLIEENHIREAKEHCAYILKSYPKYIDVYRLLGKAHLESRRYDEAEKILVRVLAVLPDDFIAHLGLSVVKEEQENLDAAIWHMERAYELKSTQTIHEELHRLFTMRDGVAPPKPLITRGALIRINVRSGLYQQALKEIDHALKEDPQRLDLEILRAKIYFQQKNIPLAVRYCKMILQKRPYAYDANLLMTEIASTTEQAEPFKQRMFELDPYTSLVDETMSLEEVPPDAIMIEKLDIPLQEPKNNAQITDELIDEVNTEAMVSVDNDVATFENQEAIPPVDMDDSTILEAQAHENAHIPDWMQEMGWEAGSSRTSEEEQALIADYDHLETESGTDSTPEGLAESDIPDWLKDLQPIEEELIEPSNNDEQKIAWLNDILPVEDVDQKENNEPISKLESVPPTKETPYSSVPEFGKDLDADQEWLEMVSSPEPKLMDPSEQSTDRPSRMPEPEEVMDFSFEEPEEEEEVNESTPVQPQAEESNDEDIDSAIAWLEGLAAKQGAEEEVLFSDLDAREEKPEWLDDDATASTSEPEEPSYMIDEEVESSIENEEVVEEIIQDEYIEQFSDSFEEKPMVEEEIPAFGAPESFVPEETEMEDTDVPEWLKAIAPPESVDNEDSTAVPETTNEPVSKESVLEIPEDLDSLFNITADNDTVVEEDLLDQVEFSEDETEPIMPETDMEQNIEEPSPLHEQFATTAVLDFIKKEVDDEIDEVDNWLKNLPQHAEEETLNASEEAVTDDQAEKLDMVSDSEIDEVFEEIEPATDKTGSDVEFIDDYFIDEVEDSQVEEPVQDKKADEPYQWEQEFENLSAEDSDLPDWIAGIEDEESQPTEAPSTQEPVEEKTPLTEKAQSGTADMPDWMLVDQTDDTEVAETVTETADETLQFETPQVEPEEEASNDMWEDLLNEGVEETDEVTIEDDMTPALEITEEDNKEELFLIAKNKLHNGDFDEAFPVMNNLIEDEQWLDQVMEVIIFDIENYHPIEVESWVLLGDAYRKQDRLKEALDAYTKAEDFIK